MLLITPEERASFSRCRRQWDFGGLLRRNLEPRQPPARPDLVRALRDGLDVYYFPGMWDWDRAVTAPLVLQGFHRALDNQRRRGGEPADEAAWSKAADLGRSLLGRYLAWAPSVDEFSPVLVAADYQVTVVHPDQPMRGVVTGDGAEIRYGGRIDMLAVDAYDAYWIVRHRLLADEWAATAELVDDDEAAAECWAWEHFNPGLTVAGTVYNEVRLPTGDDAASGRQSDTEPPRSAAPVDLPEEAPLPWPDPGTALPRSVRASHLVRALRRAAERDGPDRQTGPAQRVVRQHEPSGGGRSVPQHRRRSAAAREPKRGATVRQLAGDGFRRTWVRRRPGDIEAAGRRLAVSAAAMAAPDPAVPPNPAPPNCRCCAFLAPCSGMDRGEDIDALMSSAYRRRPEPAPELGRLGGGSWGMGRGAAPARFRADRDR